MPDREKVIKGIDICLQRFHCGEDCPYYEIGCMEQLREDALVLLKEQEAVVRCKDCKHRPKKPDWETYEISGFDLEFPKGSKCPCRCCEDEWYSWYPEDNWFCAEGEHKEGR